MAEYEISTDGLTERIPALRVGDTVYLTGTVFTARDAAHKRLFSLLDENKPLPFVLRGSVIYYAGPTPQKPDGTIGAFGPTTSARMDAFTPRLLDLGLRGIIGKGNRDAETIEAIQRNQAVYFCAGGGFGALIGKSIERCEEIAFPELGCESITRLQVNRVPLIVGVDSYGDSIFDLRG